VAAGQAGREVLTLSRPETQLMARHTPKFRVVLTHINDCTGLQVWLRRPGFPSRRLRKADMNPLLRELRHNPMLWLLALVPVALLAAKLAPTRRD
jgi:hypothetical protein